VTLHILRVELLPVKLRKSGVNPSCVLHKDTISQLDLHTIPFTPTILGLLV